MIKQEKENILKIASQETKDLFDTIKDLKIKIINREPNFLEFDLINADCAIANTLRRILSSEIPIIAVKHILVKNNTGIIPEEILAHRIGLIPILKLPGSVDLKNKKFILKIKNTTSKIMNVNSDLILGEENFFKPKVLITQLGPQEQIDLEIFCDVGIGRDHAKYSPVCPATYRLLPVLEIKNIKNYENKKLQDCFPKGVIELDSNGNSFVGNVRLITDSREVLRHEEFKEKVYLGKNPTHFIFTIETVVFDPIIILQKGILVLINQSKQLKDDILNKEEDFE